MRVFVASYRNCYGAVGGGGGVNYKLHLANKHAGFPLEMIHLFKDCSVYAGHETFAESRELTDKGSDSIIRSAAKKMLGGFAPILVKNNERRFANAVSWLKRADDEFHFTFDDIFILHDIESMIAFSMAFSYRKAAFVYHQQGSLYEEWEGFTGKHSRKYGEYLDRCFERACSAAAIVGFPSNGARECLVESNESAQRALTNQQCVILHNGFDRPAKLCAPDVLSKVIRELTEYEGLVFSTVANLNYAKGVERIPGYLKKLKDAGYNFRWVVAGRGMRSAELSEQIEVSGISECVTWVQEPVPHEDILNLFSISDFYILFHRKSIFDFATIEAMSFGAIPVLTKVGGNPEVIFGDSGLLVEDAESCDTLLRYLSHIDIEATSALNERVQREYFSEESFFNGYRNVVAYLENLK